MFMEKESMFMEEDSKFMEGEGKLTEEEGRFALGFYRFFMKANSLKRNKET